MTKKTKGAAVVGFIMALLALAASFGYDVTSYIPAGAPDALAPVIDKVLE
jgi:hypothetical protein